MRGQVTQTMSMAHESATNWERELKESLLDMKDAGPHGSGDYLKSYPGPQHLSMTSISSAHEFRLSTAGDRAVGTL